jgi:hypothetical protein
MYDSGYVDVYPYCTEAVFRMLAAHAKYGFDNGVTEVKLARRAQ